MSISEAKKAKNKKYLLNESKGFCILPWLHLYAEPNGDVFPCCTATPLWGEPNDPDFARSDLKDKTIKEALNSPLFNKLRLDMLKGDKLPGTCVRCERFEKAGLGSYRDFARNRFGKFIDVIDETKEDGSLDEYKLRFLNIRFSNHCNMSCLTCGPSWSTAWYKNAWWLQKEGKPNLVQLEDNTKGDFWEQIKPQLHNVSRIYFTGGEPMMMPDHWKILLYLIENNLQDKVELHYNTNLSLLRFGKHDVLDLWSKFKTVELGISIDGVEKDAEIIRWGTKWEVIKQNVLKIRKLPNVRYQIDSVISILNIYHLPKMEKYLLSEGMMDINTINVCNIAHEPLPFCITSIPKEHKIAVEKFLRDAWETLPASRQRVHRENGWFQVIDFMNNVDTYQPGAFSEHINSTLQFAKSDLLDLVPLVKRIYDIDQPHDRWFKDDRDYIGIDNEIHPLKLLYPIPAKYPDRIK